MNLSACDIMSYCTSSGLFPVTSSRQSSPCLSDSMATGVVVDMERELSLLLSSLSPSLLCSGRKKGRKMIRV